MQITLFGDAHSKKGLHPVETSDEEEMLLMNGGRSIILRQTSTAASSTTSTPSIMKTDSSCSTILTSPGDDHKRHIEDALDMISIPAHPRAPPIPTDAQVHRLKITHQKQNKRSTTNHTGNRKQNNKKNHHKNNKKQPNNPQQNSKTSSFYKRTEYFLDNLCVGVERDLLGPGDKDYERNKELFDRQQQEQTRKKHRQRFYVNHVWEPSADDNTQEEDTDVEFDTETVETMDYTTTMNLRNRCICLDK